jgi:chaperonin GroEL (HSP60 family)
MDRQYFKQNIAQSDLFHNTISHVFDILIENIGSTFGPFGTHNIFLNGADISSSKDGLENLTMMKIDSSVSRLIHQMSMEVANRQASVVGDGTTSAILVMAYVYKNLRNNKYLWDRYTPSMIYRSMVDIQSEIINRLEETAAPITLNEEVFAIAYTATDRNKDLTDLLMTVYLENTDEFKDKNFILDYSSTGSSYSSNVQGITITGKLMNQGFANYDLDTCKLKNCVVILVDGAPIIINDILEYSNQLKLQGKSLVILCSGVNENFHRFIEMIAQQQPALLHNLAVVYNSANIAQDKELFHDIQAISGCDYIPEGFELNKESIKNIKAGFAENILIKNRKVTLSGFNSNGEDKNLELYMKNIEEKLAELEETQDHPEISVDDKNDNKIQINKLKARYYRLKSGTTTIYVGGESNQRRTISYRLVEDAVKAMQCSLKSGYFIGCNTIVPNILYQMMIDQIETNPNEDDIYIELERILLNSYLDVYLKLILNRMKMTKSEALNLILSDSSIYDVDNDKIIIDPKNKMKIVFNVVNLVEGDQKAAFVINPALTDINIVQRAIDSALVLATSNTMLSDEIEFEGRID